MIYTEDARKLLEDMGLTSKIIEDPQDSNKDHFFIEKDIVWDKMFVHLKNHRPDLYASLDTVPHINWIKNIIISRSPKLEAFNLEGQECFGVMLPELVERGEKLQRLDQCLRFVFINIQEYITEIFNKFD